MGVCGLDSSGSGYGRMAGFCEHGSESSGYIKYWEIPEWPSYYYLMEIVNSWSK
jgi:hypothetical protein